MFKSSCPADMPILITSYQPKQKQADSGTAKIKVNQTQVRDLPGHPEDFRVIPQLTVPLGGTFGTLSKLGVYCKRDTEEDDEVSFTIGDHESLVSAERLQRRRTSRTVAAAAERPASPSDHEEDKENSCDVILEFPSR